jgi:hypothetical protein
MTRSELEHLIRAAGTIVNADDIVVIGLADAPAEFLVSNEAQSELIDGTIGEGSPFQHAFGYYAHGVDETTAILPHGWRERLVLVSGENTRFVRGWCLEVHDLAVAKYIAGREKDLDFNSALVRHGMVRRDVLEQRLRATALDETRRKLVEQRIHRDLVE